MKLDSVALPAYGNTVRNNPLRCFWGILLVWAALVFGTSGFCAPFISEFMAANHSFLADEDGDFSDWIEIYNPGNDAVPLAGYHLTDDPVTLSKWTFPATTINPGAFLVVFASGKNRTDPAGRLHTNYQLSSSGEYLALVAPDGLTVLSAFAPSYPPQFENQSFGLSTTGSPPTWTFFSTPTPGTTNSIGTRAGPIIYPTEKNPPQPVAGPLTITAKIVTVNSPVRTVRLFFRRMFAAETVLTMTDDGTAGDAVAGDGIWTAVLPDTVFGPGEMTRWRFSALDTEGSETKEPPYRSAVDSEQYYGTVTQDPRIQTRLSVFHWFTTNPGGAETLSGSRGAVYYDGEFYDNVMFYLHGQSSAGFPKKSYNIDFTHAQHFRWSTNAPRVADIGLLTNWADKSKVRHVLAYEVMRNAGVAAHFAFTVRVQRNGAFFSTADFVEDGDEIYLERAGLNKDGALYKINSNTLNKSAGDTAYTGVEKKTRKSENNSDLQALINGLALTGTNLDKFVYDNIDIPACVNLLAANSVIRNIDMHSKNWYIYCDTGRSGEWAILPWDLDLSFGRVWNTQYTYFDNGLYTDGFVVNGTAIRLVSYLFSNTKIRPMIMRRIRTLADQYLQPPPDPSTPESQLYLERRLNEQSALIDPPEIVPSDARQDFVKWGSWLQGGAYAPYTSTNVAVETMARGIQRWKTEYLPGRRKYIYNTQIVGRGGEIPLPQNGGLAITNYTPLLVAGAPVKVLVPTNSSLGATWTGYPSFEPFNTTGWISGKTGVGYERATGYESLISLNVDSLMQSNTTIYMRLEFNVADPAAFDRLELRMKYDDGFIAYLNGALLATAYAPTVPAWNSASTASREANPNAFDIYDVTDKKSNLRAGRNILAIQGLNESVASSDLIFVPELHGAKVTPATTIEPKINFGAIEANPASGNQNQEFIQLTNPNSIAVDISGWRIGGGVEHTFPGGTVLPPKGAIYITPDAAAFRARTNSPKGGEGLLVQGGYRHHLSSFAEPLWLIGTSGATNSTATYPGHPSDPQRYLVISEIMYHPPGDGLAEFIELMNISPSVTLDLRSVRFTQGVEFDFGTGAITNLPPGRRVLLVRDLAAFTAAYGTNRPIAGVFANGGALNNGGELLKLEDANSGTIREFTYDDLPPWPTLPDAGYSLVLIAPETNPDHSVAANWRASVRIGGSPGWPDIPGFPADPAGDANLNGQPDLIDYALGNDLGLQPVSPEFLPGPGGALLFTYPLSLSAQGVQITITYSTDLCSWFDASPHVELLSTQNLDLNRQLLTWQLKPSLRDQPRVFLRLQATSR